MEDVILIEDHRGDGPHRSGFTESMLWAGSRSCFDPLTRPTITQDAQQTRLNKTKTPFSSLAPESSPNSIETAGYLSTAILHDLRNPLGTICAGAEMLIDLNCGPDQVKRLAVNIKRAARRMRELLAELTSFSSGRRSATENCNIREVIAAAAESAALAAENQSVQILLEVPGEMEVPLVRSRMERVFFNLITNSLEAMPDGGKIRIWGMKAGNFIRIEVEDTGPGIPSAIRDSLFEPFVTAGKPGGIGLGLALSRQVVVDHGGDLWNEPGADGARFVVRLRLQRTEGVANDGRRSRFEWEARTASALDQHGPAAV